ncbi:mannose-specific lectin [Fusarium sporotrichioides]|uniref:Mannose-specific lectin n=1 Tax=Fusarium sporotrichioides TaxID=5514 RepID=A0A395RHT5_FUSSP|nr:mannose-specific lectin [Fusarium sporotrichioides]
MGKGTLKNGNWLMVGMSIFSKDRSVELRMQDDGKLAVYYNNRCACDEDGQATWHTNTAAPYGDWKTFVAVQDDGNIVLYKNAGATPIWSSESKK